MAEVREAIDRLVEMANAASGAGTANGAQFPYVLVPKDYRVESLEKYVYNDHAAFPERIRQGVTVHDAPSFTQYFSLFSDRTVASLPMSPRNPLLLCSITMRRLRVTRDGGSIRSS